jgi:membrane-associated phospholipid phosphatase
MKQWRIAFWSAGAYTALAVAVSLGLLDGLDVMVRDWARPDDIWGVAQMRADLVVEGLRPTIAAVLLATFTLAYCAKRRSLRPAAFVGSVCVVTVVLTVASKIIVHRLNPHAVIGNDGGSFPSGHIIGVVVCLGLVVLMVQPRVGQAKWLIPAFGGVLLGASLLLQAAHWFTDIVGGALLATGVLAVASGLSSWINNRSRNDHESTASGRPNGTWLTSVAEESIYVARLNNAVPDIGVTDCYDPGRGKFVLRSCGGL